jgi:hypothetical protein
MLLRMRTRVTAIRWIAEFRRRSPLGLRRIAVVERDAEELDFSGVRLGGEMVEKPMQLRRTDRCAQCETELAPGTAAFWFAEARMV